MGAVKQGLVVILILCGAFYAWLQFDPNAGDRLARYGLDHPVVMALASTRDAAEVAEAAPGRQSQPRSVVVSATGEASVNDRVNAIGNGQALQSVMVTPYTSGTIANVDVRSGDRVSVGDLIARLDAEEQMIAVERARLDLEDAENTLDRRNALRQASSAAISNVEITAAELAVQTARLELREAELNLSRREIRAPIEGIIGIVPVTTGDYVTSSTEIVTIDDRSAILVDFWVPERFAGQIRVGQAVNAEPVANPALRFEGEVMAVDNRVDEASRTLRVRARVPNDDDLLRAGMSFSVAMTFDGDRYPTVDPLAVQWSAEGAFVWRVNEGKSERVAVRIVQRNAASVLVDAPLAEGDRVIIEGLMQLREGAELAVVDALRAPNAPASAANAAADEDASLSTRRRTGNAAEMRGT